MRNFKFKLWLMLVLTGIVGVASLLLSDLPLDNIPAEVKEQISMETLKFIVLVNPAILVIIAATVGIFLYDKVTLSVPLLTKLIDKTNTVAFSIKRIIGEGIVWGVFAGVAIVAVPYFFKSYLPEVLFQSSDSLKLNLLTRLLYGGVTEEILCRFGLMTFIVWLLYKIFKQLNAAIYWIGIVLAAVLFGIGHLPVAQQLVGEMTFAVYTYIILANSIAGVFFGYAYWKRGLECAIIAHALAHVTMLGLGWIGG